MTKMKKILILPLLFFTVTCSYSSEWFGRNKDLSAVFHPRVWAYIERANKEDDAGRLKETDLFLRRAERKTEDVKPFMAGSWPKGWPVDSKKTLELLQYATPDAYICRIIGDYAHSHKRTKESLKYYEKYIQLSIVPDTDYMTRVADIFQKDNRLHEARIVYENMYRVIESRNFHGTEFSLSYINAKIKNLNLQLRKPTILMLDVFFSGIQDYIRSDFQKIFTDRITKMKKFSVVSRGNFEKVLSEAVLTKDDLQYSEELSILGKMLNADYILRPSLTLIDKYFIFHVDVFDPAKKIWFEDYEYKTQSYVYISNLIERFTFQFGGNDIPEGLFLPENEFLWGYETNSIINDLKMSLNGNRIIVGCESGTVYILNSKGVVVRQFNMPEKILKVAVSPCGKYYSWLALNGVVSFADEYGGVIRWSEKIGNSGRDLDISKDGKFVVIGINNEVIFKDRRGEVFWSESLPQWATRIRISEDSRRVFVGMENGTYWCFSDDGNILWKKNLNSRIIDIKVSPNNYSCVVNKSGKTFVFDAKGDELLSFNAGEKIQYSVFKPEIIELLAGQKGKYVYLLSYDKTQLWEYNLSDKISFMDALADGRFICTVEGKNVFVFRVVWK